MSSQIENRENFIHDRVLQDLIAAHLYVTTALADDEEVLELTLSPPDKAGLRTINYNVIKNKEVELIVHSCKQSLLTQ